jgi:ribulose-phosphate 3-epimerase
MIDDAGLDVEIEVDGGIKVENVDEVTRAGANVLVAGAGIFATKDYQETIAKMRANAERGQSEYQR